MAYKIFQLTGGTVIPGGDYPWGMLVDAPGGTVVNKKMIADMWQFFQNLMAEGGIIANGLEENVSNGFQLMEALKRTTGTPDLLAENRVNLDGDTITFDKSRTIIYSATTGSGPGITPIFDMTGAIAGSEVIIKTGLPGAGVFVSPTGGGTIDYIYLSQLIIGASANGSFRFKVAGYTGGVWYLTAEFFGY